MSVYDAKMTLYTDVIATYLCYEGYDQNVKQSKNLTILSHFFFLHLSVIMCYTFLRKALK